MTHRFLRQIDNWNQRFHIYIGLYLLFFVWLLSVSGLLLNHPTWRISQFWPERIQSSFERNVKLKEAGDPRLQVKEAMRQLDISGEIEKVGLEKNLQIQVVRPGQIFNIEIDPTTKRAQIDVIKVNSWGVLHMLHSFTGVRMDNPEKRRDWMWTWVWSICLDALAVGLVILVLSGLYMWYRVRRSPLELVFLLAGTTVCGFFIFLGSS